MKPNNEDKQRSDIKHNYEDIWCAKPNDRDPAASFESGFIRA